LQTQTTSTREYENRSLFAWPFLGTENGYIFHLEHADLTPSVRRTHFAFVFCGPICFQPVSYGSEASFLISNALPSTATQLVPLAANAKQRWRRQVHLPPIWLLRRKNHNLRIDEQQRIDSPMPLSSAETVDTMMQNTLETAIKQYLNKSKNNGSRPQSLKRGCKKYRRPRSD
jgi:hypothetical protein